MITFAFLLPTKRQKSKQSDYFAARFAAHQELQTRPPLAAHATGMRLWWKRVSSASVKVVWSKWPPEVSTAVEADQTSPALAWLADLVIKLRLAPLTWSTSQVISGGS